VKLGIRGPIPGSTLRERAESLRRTGYSGIELGGEYLSRTADDLLGELDGTGIEVTAIVGSIALLAADPKARASAVPTDRERVVMAKRLGAESIIEVPVFGQPKFDDLPDGTSAHAYGTDLLVAQLSELAPDLEKHGVDLILEPLNRYETRFMNRLEQAVEVIDRVGSGRIKILADFFHMQIEERAIADSIRRAGARVGYVHLADSNRLQPGAGHTDFRAGFDALKSVGYDGWLTIESGLVSPYHQDEQLVAARELISATWASASS